MDPALAAALARVAEAGGECRDKWWVIGSAAMALHGAAPLEVGDIDLLVSRSDAVRLLERANVKPGPGPEHANFHSEVFGRVELGTYTVEVMGGFHVHNDRGWQELAPCSRQAVNLGEHTLFIPSVQELIAIGRLFGRAKDAERERLLLSLFLR